MSTDSTTNQTKPPSHDFPENEQYEEECVICLEELCKNEEWGRCTPCNHAFHKKCWWNWENSHHERIESARRRGEETNNEGPKCCLCNTVVKQFVDGQGEPAHNPEPFVADEEDDKGFFDWFFRRGRGGNDSESAENGSNDMNGAMEFLERMAQQGGSVMGLDASVLLDQLRFGGGFGMNFPHVQTETATIEAMVTIAVDLTLAACFKSGEVLVHLAGRSTNATNDGPFNQILPDTPVVIQDLVNSPHLNGQRGKVNQYNQQTERYLIKLDSNNVTIALKPENILQVLTIKILGLVSQPLFNGKEGTIVSYNKDRNRYVVRVSLPNETKEISIKAQNIRIPDLSRVRLEGLENQPQWNGRYGTIMKWEDGRYEVKISHTYSVRVKVENVRL
ncbi:hypothetical protein ACHAXN_009328 [Cyclotella atomus]